MVPGEGFSERGARHAGAHLGLRHQLVTARPGQKRRRAAATRITPQKLLANARPGRPPRHPRARPKPRLRCAETIAMRAQLTAASSTDAGDGHKLMPEGGASAARRGSRHRSRSENVLTTHLSGFNCDRTESNGSSGATPRSPSAIELPVAARLCASCDGPAPSPSLQKKAGAVSSRVGGRLLTVAYGRCLPVCRAGGSQPAGSDTARQATTHSAKDHCCISAQADNRRSTDAAVAAARRLN